MSVAALGTWGRTGLGVGAASELRGCDGGRWRPKQPLARWGGLGHQGSHGLRGPMDCVASILRPDGAVHVKLPEGCGEILLATGSRKVPPTIPASYAVAQKSLNSCRMAALGARTRPSFDQHSSMLAKIGTTWANVHTKRGTCDKAWSTFGQLDQDWSKLAKIWPNLVWICQTLTRLSQCNLEAILGQMRRSPGSPGFTFGNASLAPFPQLWGFRPGSSPARGSVGVPARLLVVSFQYLGACALRSRICPKINEYRCRGGQGVEERAPPRRAKA